MQHKMQFKFNGYTLKQNRKTNFLLASQLGTQGDLALHAAIYIQGLQSPFNHLYHPTPQLNK